MSDNKAANNRCAELFLNNYYYEKFKTGDPYCSLELIFTPQCNLKCSYCYLWKNEQQLFSNCRAETKQILHNLELVLQWMEKNQFHPDLDIFSGEFLAQSLGYEALELIYQYQSRWPAELRSSSILIPTNMTFVCNDDLIKKVDTYIEKFNDIGIKLFLSASVDGKFIESNRRYDASLDIPIEVERDDAYYEKLFNYCVQRRIRFHPMIYSKHIGKWKDNYLWFKENLIKRGLSPFDFYLLEVRNEEWTKKDIIEFQSFLEFLYQEAWEYCEHDVQKFVSHLLSYETNLNILGHSLYHQSNRYSCSLQRALCIRLDDLAVPPCHRTGYEYLLYGRYQPDEQEVLRFESSKVELMSTLHGMGTASLPYCTECPINELCIGQCIGAMHESNKNLFTPIPSVCALEHAKTMTLVACLVKYNAFDAMMQQLSPVKRFQLEKLKEIVQC